jgi:TIR domain/CAP12/Pycsar effector protein, TIR domain
MKVRDDRPSVLISSSIEAVDVAHELARLLEQQGVAARPWSVGDVLIGISATEALIAQMAEADFAVILVDTRSREKGRRERQPRANVIFELGLAVGALGTTRVLPVVLGESRGLPSNLAAMRYAQLDDPPDPSAMQRSAEQIRMALQALEPRGSQPSYYSCFLSYSIGDSNFINRLVADLTISGVPCWLDAREIRTGARIDHEIRQGLSQQDKMLLVLSQNSTRSSWVEKEVDLAFRLERERGREVVFPLRLDSSVFESNAPWVEHLAGT